MEKIFVRATWEYSAGANFFLLGGLVKVLNDTKWS